MEDVAQVPVDPIPGRSLVTRRALRDLIRNAALGVYGVTGLAGAGPLSPLVIRLGIIQPGIRLSLSGELAVDLHLLVAYGLPVAEVARQVDSSVRYAVRHALGREIDRLTIHVDGLRYDPGTPPPPSTSDQATTPRPGDLAASGTDVA